MTFSFTFSRPKKSVAGNWVSDEVTRRTKEWPVEIQTSGVMPETPGESALHIRLVRETGKEDEDGKPIFEKLTTVLCLEDMIRLHRAVENLLLAPLACSKKLAGERCRGTGGMLHPLLGPCSECERHLKEYNVRWELFRAWEAERLALNEDKRKGSKGS